MIDININAIISQALAAAVAQANAPLLDTIIALRQEYANKMGEMAERIAALEDRIAVLAAELIADNPAQGVDTTLEAAQQQTLQSLDNQEWFWDKIRNFTDGAVESAIEQHCEEYDHDDYDRVVSALDGVDLDDYVTKDDMRDEVSDAVHDKLDNATLSIRF